MLIFDHTSVLFSRPFFFMWVLEIKLSFLHFMEHVLSLIYVCAITPTTLRRGIRSVSSNATVASPPLRLTMLSVSCSDIAPHYQHEQGLSCVLLYLIGLPEVFRLNEYNLLNESVKVLHNVSIQIEYHSLREAGGKTHRILQAKKLLCSPKSS